VDRFVGRVDELHQVESAVRRGRGRLITVAGPAGVGKTRFCEEGADRARDAGYAVVWGRCWTDGGAPALWPWHPIVSELCGADTAALLDCDAGLDSVDPQRFSRFRAVGDRLAATSGRPPTLLVIDDLHAADPGAVLLTRFVARSLHRLALVMVITHRPGEAKADSTPLLADLEREGDPITLRCFDLDETRAFLAEHGVDHLDPELTEALHRVTEGNPLFLRRLVALDAADRTGGLPDGLRNAIDQSLRQLRPPTVRLLTVSAILGMSVRIAEAAAMVGVGHLAVLDALHEAAGAGLVRIAGAESFTFGHDLVRQTLVAKLMPGELLDTHARAAEIIRATTEPGSSDRLARQAHHAIHAAARSADDARAAVATCRAAARSSFRHFAYEQAATLLATAERLHDSACLSPAPASLLLEWANAVLSSGRLAEARPLFDRSAAAAHAEQQPVLFAEAALGLGGIWVNEHRDRVERARVLGLQREALAQLPPGHFALRCRLIIRQAAEDVYDGGPVTGVLATLEQARRIGDPRVLAEALSLCHHALLAPEHTRKCLALAEELVSVASAAGLEVLALMGLCWRTVDLFRLGDPRAERSLADLRARADLLSCHSVLFIIAAMDVMLLLRAGKLDEAEQQAVTCFQLGTQVGDADALAYHSAHLLVIRWLQGRGAELVDLAEQTANSPTLVDAELTFHATLARLAADAGQHDRARSALHRLTAGGLAAIPLSSTWLACMLAIAETAATLGDIDIARQAYDLLQPYADLPIMPSLAVVCFGSTQRPLGLAAMTFGDLDRAVEHLHHAVAANIRLANRPFTACARADLAEALRRRDASGDRQWASELLHSAIAEATAMGMTVRANTWATTLHALNRPIVISRHTDRWLLTYHERQIVVDDLVGMHYLAQLLAHPNATIPALDLVSGNHRHGVQPTNQAVIDNHAHAAYIRRARDLADELADARDNADLARVERIELELDALTTEIGHTTGLNGRPRNFTGPAERARTAVRKAIKRAIDAIDATDPDIAAALRATITTGYHCGYTPPAETEPAPDE
jgi:AAA ATPase-like protein